MIIRDTPQIYKSLKPLTSCPHSSPQSLIYSADNGRYQKFRALDALSSPKKVASSFNCRIRSPGLYVGTVANALTTSSPTSVPLHLIILFHINLLLSKEKAYMDT